MDWFPIRFRFILWRRTIGWFWFQFVFISFWQRKTVNLVFYLVSICKNLPFEKITFEKTAFEKTAFEKNVNSQKSPYSKNMIQKIGDSKKKLDSKKMEEYIYTYRHDSNFTLSCVLWIYSKGKKKQNRKKIVLTLKMKNTGKFIIEFRRFRFFEFLFNDIIRRYNLICKILPWQFVW